MNIICATIKTIIFMILFPITQFYNAIKEINLTTVVNFIKLTTVVISLLILLSCIILIPFFNCILGLKFFRDNLCNNTSTIKQYFFTDLIWIGSISSISLYMGHPIEDIISVGPILAITSTFIVIILNSIGFNNIKTFITEKYNSFYIDCSNKN